MLRCIGKNLRLRCHNRRDFVAVATTQQQTTSNNKSTQQSSAAATTSSSSSFSTQKRLVAPPSSSSPPVLCRRNISDAAVETKLQQGRELLDETVSSCLQYKVGDNIRGYTVDKIERVAELNLVSVLLSHNKTGAQHLHIGRNDSNNTFGVTFRTTPMDSTGVPHILEHTALCGSKSYPVRDPFFKMLNRSLSTFMNAMTASDWTMYPFSSQNSKDFRNLMSVYLDAAFCPLLRENDFRQEGWRLENEDLEDPNSPIIFKGVVFNEMKGVFSSQHSIFQEAAQNKLLPHHTYGVCSGGLPIAIPDLTWEGLKEFHASHYHPSNAKFYTYGDRPLEENLEQIEEQVLKHFDKIPVNTQVPREPRWAEPRRSDITCHKNDMLPDPNKQTTVAVSFLLEDVTNVYDSSVLSIISSLLVSGTTSPFYQSLIEGNIGSSFAPVCGYEGSTRDGSFSVGLEGIRKEDTDKVLAIIQETFEKVAQEGFSSDRVDGLLHQIELSTKHQTPGFGLHLLMSIASTWNHEANPAECLSVNRIVEQFKKDLKENPDFLKDKVKKYFLNNKHKSTVVMSPDENYEEKLQQAEDAKLKAKVDQLSAKDKEKIFYKGKELAKAQNELEDLSSLPTLKVSDIDRELVRTITEKISVGGVGTQLCEQPTNQVVYFKCISGMSHMPASLNAYVPLFCTLATKMGAGDLDYKQQSQNIERYTGGLGIGAHIAESPSNLRIREQGICFGSYCLVENMPKMFELWTDIFTRIKMEDEERLNTLLRMAASDMVNAIPYNGHQYAMLNSSSCLSEYNRTREIMTGITQINFLKDLTENENQVSIIQIMRDIAGQVLRKEYFRCALNAEPNVMQSAVNQLESFVTALSGTNEVPLDFVEENPDIIYPQCTKNHYKMDLNVNYAGLSVPTVPYTHADFASVRVLGRLLTNKYLHREIREKGGAYGGGANGSSPGLLSFYSYRDPSSLQTIETMESSANWIRDTDFTQTDVDEAILATFQKVDAPTAPGARGMSLFMAAVTDDMRQTHREQLKEVTIAKIKEASEKYLSSPSVKGVTLIGPENAAVQEDPSWNQL